MRTYAKAQEAYFLGFAAETDERTAAGFLAGKPIKREALRLRLERASRQLDVLKKTGIVNLNEDPQASPAHQ
jgi:hypothetical protein